MLGDQGDLVAGVAQPRGERPVKGADPAAGDGVQVPVHQRDTHGRVTAGRAGVPEGVPLGFEQGQTPGADFALGEFGVQAQLAGEHHCLVDQERHFDPSLAHHSVDGVLGAGGVGEQGVQHVRGTAGRCFPSTLE